MVALVLVVVVEVAVAVVVMVVVVVAAVILKVVDAARGRIGATNLIIICLPFILYGNILLKKDFF